jgi:hypothetical protein
MIVPAEGTGEAGPDVPTASESADGEPRKRRGRARTAERATPPPPPRATTSKPSPEHPRRAPRRRQPPVLAACPTCAVLLDPPPTASRLCVACRERIVVRRLEKGVLYLTSAAARRLVEAQRREVETTRHMAVRDRWLALAVDVGAPAAALRRIVTRPATGESVDTARALYVRAADRAAAEARRERRFGDVVAIRRTEATALHRADGAPVPASDIVTDALTDAAACELRALRGPRREARVAAGGCCPVCAADDGHVGRVSDELRAMRLPHLECARGRCRCRWSVVRVTPSATRRTGASARTAGSAMRTAATAARTTKAAREAAHR